MDKSYKGGSTNEIKCFGIELVNNIEYTIQQYTYICLIDILLRSDGATD